MKTYQVHLIRHGLTEGNLKGQYIGQTNVPLSSRGINDLHNLVKNFTYHTADFYYTSPLLRCIQTMSILYPHTDFFEVPGLAEVNFGDWEGKTAQDLAGDPNFAQWLEMGGSISPPNGESNGEFVRRTCEAFENLVDNMMKTKTYSSVIVAHGGTIMTLLATYGLPRANFYDWMTEAGHGYSLRVTPSLWMSGRVVEVYDTIPTSKAAKNVQSTESDERLIIDVGREAANRAYGTESESPTQDDEE